MTDVWMVNNNIAVIYATNICFNSIYDYYLFFKNEKAQKKR